MRLYDFRKLLENINNLNENEVSDGILEIINQYSRKGSMVKVKAMLINDEGEFVEIDSYAEDINSLNYTKEMFDFLHEYDVTQVYNVNPDYYDYDEEDGYSEYDFVMEEVDRIRSSKAFKDNDIELFEFTQNFKPFLLVFASRTDKGRAILKAKN
jgi:hypothetical protein